MRSREYGSAGFLTMNIRNGLPAGAAGTAALNAFTYIDMALRGRPPSELPQKIVSSLAEKIGIEHIDDSRRSALGALLGYADGFGAGALLGIVRPHIRGVPWLWTSPGGRNDAAERGQRHAAQADRSPPMERCRLDLRRHSTVAVRLRRVHHVRSARFRPIVNVA
jgi:hypothetical protein